MSKHTIGAVSTFYGFSIEYMYSPLGSTLVGRKNDMSSTLGLTVVGMGESQISRGLRHPIHAHARGSTLRRTTSFAPRLTMLTRGYHGRLTPICSKISSLLKTLANGSPNYDSTAPKIEYWIEYVLNEGFASVDELVEGVSRVAWNGVQGSYATIARFFKEFYDASHRSEQARSFVSQLCAYALRWFAIASTESLCSWSLGLVSIDGPYGFVRAASFIGHLIERGLLNHELVRRHLIKPLTNHVDTNDVADTPGGTRAKAIYQLFLAAGNTLLQGTLEPDDVQVCFDKLDCRNPRHMEFDEEKLEVQCTSHDGASRLSLTYE